MKTYDLPALTNAQAAAALDEAVAQVRVNLPLYTDRCQNHSSVDNLYPACDNTQWTCGFWPGEVWLSYERTGDEAFKTAAMTLVQSFDHRIRNKIEVDHHDMGFLYSPSCVAAYKLTGDETARDAAILAADQLMARFQPKGQFIQAWGAMGAPENYRYIIDCLLNLPLLYWASEVTGDAKYADIAHRHITTCLANSFRPDGSTYHTFFMNPDGTPSHGATCQGYKDDSFWARGQAWGVYGSVLSYRYTKNPGLPGHLPQGAGLLPHPPARRPGAVLGYGVHHRHRRTARLLQRGHRGLRPAGSLQVGGRRGSRRLRNAGAPDARQPGGALRCHRPQTRRRADPARHVQQKEPLQHLHARGRR